MYVRTYAEICMQRPIYIFTEWYIARQRLSKHGVKAGIAAEA
jgi:hypothetical protein